MPRHAAAATPNLSLSQLEKLMNTRKRDLSRLEKQRDKVQKKLDAINAKILEIGGTVSTGRRAHNEVSLQDLIHQVLSKASSPLSVSDILAKVEASGYRSNSANFRGIVNQTLIKDKRFVAASRGVYKLK